MKKVSMFLLGLVLSVLSFAAVLDNGFNAAFGPLFHPAPHVPPLVGPAQGLDSLHRWNVTAINASGLDHTPVAPGENRVIGEQLGPGRASPDVSGRGDQPGGARHPRGTVPIANGDF